MTDGEAYYVLVRAVNALGLVITVRSDGITVKRDPLIPGYVYDGPLVGVDMTYQQETDRISASWSGFGKGFPDHAAIQHSGRPISTQHIIAPNLEVLALPRAMLHFKKMTYCHCNLNGWCFNPTNLQDLPYGVMY